MKIDNLTTEDLTPLRRNQDRIRYPFRELEIGQSILMPHGQYLQSTLQSIKRSHGFTYKRQKTATGILFTRTS